MDKRGRITEGMKDSFFITLLSNSSMKYFPDNTTTKFCTQLPKTISLEGYWEVALTDIQFPCTIATVRETQNIIYYNESISLNGDQIQMPFKTHIDSGDYTDVEKLIIALNSNKQLLHKVQFHYNTTSKKVTVSFSSPQITSLTLSPILSLQLGYEPYTDLYKHNSGVHPANISLGLPQQIFIYCDIIEPQIIGDVAAKVLRIVSVDKHKYYFGSNQEKSFSPLHYIPILKRSFENIEIHLLTNTGEKVPFRFGTAYVKLHFKKVD